MTSDILDKIDEAYKSIINEHNWNYHYGSSHDGRPYISDNKYMMFGRDTGHFGSGTYFSTYKDRNLDIEGDPRFICIKNGLYRVDFDIYKNLYRVHNTQEGKILYTLLRHINGMYNTVNNGDYDVSHLYQVIERNSNALHLECPKYRVLIRMMLEYHQSDKLQSFSTYFMEYNGYNGVNVSGINEFDNTTHGSVIYDLSKVEGKVKQIPMDSLPNTVGDYVSTTMVKSSKDDMAIDALNGNFSNNISVLNNISTDKAMRILKNYIKSNNLVDADKLYKLNDNLLKLYLMYVYKKRPYGRFGSLIDNNWIKEYSFIDAIEKVDAYYWINYIEDGREESRILIRLINNFDTLSMWDEPIERIKSAKTNFLNKILSYLERELTNKEYSFINDFINEEE